MDAHWSQPVALDGSGSSLGPFQTQPRIAIRSWAPSVSLASTTSNSHVPRPTMTIKTEATVSTTPKILEGSFRPFPGSCPVQILEPSRYITRQVYLLPRQRVAYPGTQDYTQYPKGSVVLPKSPKVAAQTMSSGQRPSCNPTVSEAMKRTRGPTRTPLTPRGVVKQAEGRKRTIFTDSQCHYLRTIFKETPYIDRDTEAQVAESLDVSPDIVGVWFKNRRSKVKKQLRVILLQAGRTWL